jgi:hypothetical protein
MKDLILKLLYGEDYTGIDLATPHDWGVAMKNLGVDPRWYATVYRKEVASNAVSGKKVNILEELSLAIIKDPFLFSVLRELIRGNLEYATMNIKAMAMAKGDAAKDLEKRLEGLGRDK